jgi:hypothetical protein
MLRILTRPILLLAMWLLQAHAIPWWHAQMTGPLAGLGVAPAVAPAGRVGLGRVARAAEPARHP